MLKQFPALNAEKLFYWWKMDTGTKIERVDFNPYPKLNYLNFQPLEVVSRYRDLQPQVVENYLYLLNLRTNIYKSRCLHSHFIPNNSGLIS